MIIRQKEESQNEDNKKTKHTKFSVKQTFLTPWYAHIGMLSGRKKCLFFLKIWCALFSCYLRLEIHPFVLLPMNLQHTLESIAVKSLPPPTFIKILLRKILEALSYLHNIFWDSKMSQKELRLGTTRLMGTLIPWKIVSKIFSGYDILLDKICRVKSVKIFQVKVFQKKAEAFLELCQASVMKLFPESSLRLSLSTYIPWKQIFRCFHRVKRKLATIFVKTPHHRCLIWS